MRRRSLRLLSVLSLVLGAGILGAGVVRAQDKGETAEAKKLKGRATAPSSGDIDGAATLDALLAKNTSTAFSQSKGASIEGWVVQAEREEDGDFHLSLAASKGETDTRKWMIVEVTPAWQKKAASLSPDALRKLIGTRVRVTGWLYWEPDEEQEDPRGTRWEIHPVTSIAPVK